MKAKNKTEIKPIKIDETWADDPDLWVEIINIGGLTKKGKILKKK